MIRVVEDDVDLFIVVVNRLRQLKALFSLVLEG
jgi:hypothetical protein